MGPMNNIYVGGNLDPLLSNNPNTINNIDAQLRLLQQQQDQLIAIREGASNIQQSTQQSVRKEPIQLIWDSIDSELLSLSESQREKLIKNEIYQQNNEELQILIQEEILKLVKPKIESYEEGKALLSKQHKLVKDLKVKVLEESDREIELFTRFREFSRNNPGITYEEFLKSL